MQKHSEILRLCLLWVLCSMLHIGASAQRKTEPSRASAETPFEKAVKGFTKYSGFIDFYYSPDEDKLLLHVKKWNADFLYVESLTSAIGSNDIGLDRNQLGNQRIVRFEKAGQKVFLTEYNTFYRAVSSNEAERNAVRESFASSVLGGFKIVADAGDGSALIDATDFLLQDVHNVSGTLRSADEGSFSVDRSRSSFYPERTKNFPLNTEIEVLLTFSGQPTGRYLSSVIPGNGSFTVREHHEFVELPDSEYVPRTFDPRAGYWSVSWYDYAKPFTEPLEQRVISRHRLKKKDPNAAISEAVKPIVYYVDPGAPEAVRNALIEGAGWWNQAFEAAGYKDAFQVKVLPDGADPMDIRYNMINWVHRSTRGWSYGSGVTDPRTGEIIKGNVSLGSLRDRQDFLIAEGLLAPYEDGKPLTPALEQMTLQRLKQLSAHEVGHTLGLAHSYTSSSESRASVMDYPQPNVQLINGSIDLSNAYDNKIGAWDKAAITFGYQDYPPGTDPIKAGDAIIQASLKAGLTFLSDQDARPAGSAHPYAHLWDNGKDVVSELNRMMDIRALVLKNFGEKNIRPNAPMALLEEALVPMYFYHRYQSEAAAKLIGGLDYRYAIKGDHQPVTRFIDPAAQMKALEALIITITPEALMLPETLLQKIPPRPIGYDRHRELAKIRTTLTFDALGIAESSADMTLGLILHPARANRLIEYHARESSQPALENIIDRLFSATIKATPRSGYAGAIQRIVNYVVVNRLIDLSLNNEASLQAKATASLKLEQLKVWLSQQRKLSVSEEWAAQNDYLIRAIGLFQASPDKFKQEHFLETPPGSPIGDDGNYCTYR